MKKGSTKLLVIVGIVALLLCSWYMLIDNTAKSNAQYAQYINTARDKVNTGLYQVALEHYDQAKAFRDSIELREEMAQVYKDGGFSAKYEAFCTEIMTDYPYEVVGYERLAELYNAKGHYKLFYNIKKSADKRGVVSEKINEIAKSLEYAYDKFDVSAVEVGGQSGGYTMAKRENGYWGFINEKGSIAIPAQYVKVSPFGNNVFYAETKKGEYGLFDKKGKMVSRVADGRVIEDCTLFNNGRLAAKYNGKYHVCDENFKELFGTYDYVSVFSADVAAVMVDNKWGIVDKDGKQVIDFVFEEIKLDDIGMAFRNNRGFAKQNGKYILIDAKGNRIGDSSWDDVDAFNAEMIAAVCQGGKWGFINADGDVVVEYKYAAAKSFKNGMAAVQVSGKWGYIGTDYAMKIAETFDEAEDFTKKGSAFVKEGNQWRMIQIYRLA